MAWIETASGRRIAHDVEGDGPPLLLIAGYGAARRGWAPLVQALAPSFRVATLDNRDAGEHDPESEQYTIADLAADAAALLDALGIERTHVLGHSMGGFIALHLALDRPDLVERLILVSTSAVSGVGLGMPVTPPDPAEWIDDPVARTRRRYSAMAALGFFDAHPAVLDQIGETARGNRLTFDGMTRQSLAFQTSHDVRARLAEITAPTLVIHGDRDRTVSVKGGQKLAAGIPGARLLVLPGVGHLPQWERPEEFQRAVRDFLAG